MVSPSVLCHAKVDILLTSERFLVIVALPVPRGAIQLTSNRAFAA
jgi:hypothetical protein